ncbi:mercury(II) reductase [Propionibacteriaceae bacterium G1746]
MTTTADERFTAGPSPQHYQLAVIGSGGAAFAAAIHATTLGKSVVMIERGTLGGTCVNTGCVPSKALIAAAEARHIADDASRFPGIATAAGPVDMAALVAGKQGLVESLRGEKYIDVANSYGWAVRQGDAAFVGTPDEPLLTVTAADGSVEVIEADHYLVATGSRPWAPLIEGLGEAGYLTSTTAMELDEVPTSLLVLGGGPVALEQAQLFARLGSSVTVLARSRLASKEEPEVSQVLEGAFADEGIQVVRRAVPVRMVREGSTGQVVVTADVAGSEQQFRADHVLVALGRRAVTEGLGLNTVGVATGELGEVVVSDRMQSSNPRIWAAGDVTGHPEYVYVAANHGTLVAENAFAAADRSVDYSRLPRVTFTSPAVGAVGMTEQEVVAAGIRCDCRVLALHHLPRAVVNRDTRGFIKMVVNADTNEILGLSSVAKDAGELAATGVHLIGKTIAEVADAWAPYLTMAEGIRIVARTFTTKAELLSCCA